MASKTRERALGIRGIRKVSTCPATIASRRHYGRMNAAERAASAAWMADKSAKRYARKKLQASDEYKVADEETRAKLIRIGEEACMARRDAKGISRAAKMARLATFVSLYERKQDSTEQQTEGRVVAELRATTRPACERREELVGIDKDILDKTLKQNIGRDKQVETKSTSEFIADILGSATETMSRKLDMIRKQAASLDGLLEGMLTQSLHFKAVLEDGQGLVTNKVAEDTTIKDSGDTADRDGVPAKGG